MIIKNREQLLSIGNTRSRKVVLDVLESCIESLDVSHVINKILILEGNSLRVGERVWNLDSKDHIFVIGAGKACNTMAEAVEGILGNRVSKGLVIVKRIETDDDLEHIELVEGGHPLPNQDGYRASQAILEIVENATQNDLIISLISGGSSALMDSPLPGITLEEEAAVTELLLKSGARIREINAVRRHLSATNGGRLAQRIEAKGAELINLVVSDVVGDGVTTHPERPCDYFGTPVAPDDTFLSDAVGALDKYALWTMIPETIVNYLKSQHPEKETPKSFGDRVHHFVLQRTGDASEAALAAAQHPGLNPVILTTHLEGEARQAGTFLGCLTKEIVLQQRPFRPPCLLIAGGENTTLIEREPGLGGPSQELSLGFALEIADIPGCCLAAVDTDGTDGPTDVAGGLVDSTTIDRAVQKGLDVYEALMAHNSTHLLQTVGDSIITGNTGTNLCDLNLILILGD